MSRGKIALVGVNPWQKTRFFGGYVWRDSQLHIQLRTIDGPDTMEGAFTWTDEQLIFDGIGIGCPDGHGVFERLPEAGHC